MVHGPGSGPRLARLSVSRDAGRSTATASSGCVPGLVHWGRPRTLVVRTYQTCPAPTSRVWFPVPYGRAVRLSRLRPREPFSEKSSWCSSLGRNGYWRQKSPCTAATLMNGNVASWGTNATTRPEGAGPAGRAERFTRGHRDNRRQARRRQRQRNLIMSDVSAVESSRSAQIGRAPHDNRHIASTTRCFPLPGPVLTSSTRLPASATGQRCSGPHDVKMVLGLIARRIAATQLLLPTAT